jgi:hypothetical protein
MPKDQTSGKGKTIHSLITAIAYVISVMIISGATLIASIIYTSPDYPQFKRPIEYLGYALLAAVCVGLLVKAGFDIYAEFFQGRRPGIRAESKKSSNLFADMRCQRVWAHFCWGSAVYASAIPRLNWPAISSRWHLQVCEKSAMQ